MKVLILTQYYYPEIFRINDLVEGLIEKGHRVAVLTGQPNYPGGRFFAGYGDFVPRSDHCGGACVWRVPLIPRMKGKGVNLILNYLSFALTASILGPLLIRERPDVLFVFEPSPVTVGIPARVIKWWHRVPLIFWVQDLWPESLVATGAVKSPLLLRLVGLLVRWIYAGCDMVLAQSKSFIGAIKKAGGKHIRVEYFPNSAETHYCPLTPAADAPEHHRMPPGFRILFAGNIGAAQDFETVLGAAEILRQETQIQWIVLGDGRQAPWLLDQVRKRGLSNCVHLLGRFPAETMPIYFALSDVLLVSLRRDPVFGLTIPSKVQSYLACGKPVLAVLEGEGRRVIETSRAGLVCPAGDAQALSQAALQLYRMPRDERQAMGQRGRAYFEAHFERSYLLDKLDKWMREFT